MIDVHCHLLPGVDDGARDVDEAVATLRELAGQGYAAVVLTPHLRGARVAQGLPSRFDRAFEALRPAAPAEVALFRGVELMLDVPIPELPTPERFTLARSRYLLVEFPLVVLAQTATSLIAQLKSQGLIPLVAHPERYGSCSVPAVRAWRAAGAAIQVDATTMTSRSGRGERARALLEHGLADVLAADNHGDSRSLLAAAEFLEAFGAERAAMALTLTNPHAMVENRDLEPVEPVQFVGSLLDRMRLWMRSRAEPPRRRRSG